jgi:aminopeptidase-like protein
MTLYDVTPNNVLDREHDASRHRAYAAQRIVSISRVLYPVQGLIVSPELDRAFDVIKTTFPSVFIHEYPSGMRAEDWEVPNSWQALSCTIRDEKGEVWVSLNDSFLLVAPFSEPVDGWFSKAELRDHVLSRQDSPDAFLLEHRNAYDFNRRDWNVTLPYSVFERMPDEGRYHVQIRTRTEPGSLKVAEWIIPGRRPDIICFCSQFDELCNDGQSSALLGLELFQWMENQPQAPEFTYQFLAVPELIGTLFYAYNNRDILDRTVGMFNLETLGAGRGWVLKRALQPGCVIEAALEQALKDLSIPYTSCSFFEGYGNDERVYGWPTIGIPGVGLQRYPFQHYHTMHDTPDVLELTHLQDALKICQASIDILETNFVPRFRNFLPPWLTRHNLYYDSIRDAERFSKLNNKLLYSIDGRRSLIDLATLAELPFADVRDYVTRLHEKGLVERLPLSLKRMRGCQFKD